MANDGDYKNLKNKWLTKTHAVGSPEIGALIDIAETSETSRQEIAMADGEYFTASLVRDNVPANAPDSFVVINTGAQYLVLEELSINLDYGGIVDGNVTIESFFYADASNKSTITTAGGTPVNMGVPLNMDFVNKVSLSTFNFDSTTSVTGDADFVVFSSQYYKDSSGNRETITGLQSSFFEKGRKIIMSPNSMYLFRTVRTGIATGTTSSLTQFSFTEVTS